MAAVSFLGQLASFSNLSPVAVIGLASLAFIIIKYSIDVLLYHHAHTFGGNSKGELPPKYPTLVPWLGGIFQIAVNHKRLTDSVSIEIAGFTYFVFQDRETLIKLFKSKALASAIDMYEFSNNNILGCSKESSKVYRADTSGPMPQPDPRSNVLPHNRVDSITHSLAFRGFTGPGMQPATRRFARDVPLQLAAQGITTEWKEILDFAQFFRESIGPSSIQCIFGPTLLRLHPTFVKDIFEFDRIMPQFTAGMPRVLMPEQYKFRDSIAEKLKSWYVYAREHFDPSMIEADGDGDPIWGSAMIRNRQEQLLKADAHDDDVLAHLDLGLAWATIGNLVISCMFGAYHILQDKTLLKRVRQELHDYLGDRTVHEVDPHQLGRDIPLLSSIYAETMRLHIKIYSAYSSPHEDVDLGKWTLPRKALALVNSAPSHMDKSFWNTKNGQYPVETFWADRFIVDPADAESGPINPEVRRSMNRAEKKRPDMKPYFSMDGCEGAWVPYGGGFSMCPGRFIAKAFMIFSATLLASEYEVEFHNDTIEISDYRYGMGVDDVGKPIPFHIRKRASAA
ncbi:Pfs, NACHT and ankyrin domain protein [Xylariaceae sp. FL1019]|nr:Pfs, NACHT and ankyrin domain protein [Xylariaceae sp. FL1019]